MFVCVQNTDAFWDYTFNLGKWKWQQTNNWAPWCLQRQNITSYALPHTQYNSLQRHTQYNTRSWLIRGNVVLCLFKCRKIFFGLQTWVSPIISIITEASEPWWWLTLVLWALAMRRSSVSSYRPDYAGHRPDRWLPGPFPAVGYHTESWGRKGKSWQDNVRIKGGMYWEEQILASDSPTSTTLYAPSYSVRSL